jgi:hypothetical protein
MEIEFNLLIVEDDDFQYETYSDTASEMCSSQENVRFILTRKTNASSAKQALLSKGFDAAIVDLNLKASETQEASGNDVLKEIIGNLRFPVFVVSGNLNMLIPEIESKKSSFLRFYDRDTENKIIFQEIEKICLTGITRILGGRGLIEDKLTDIFWNHLANDLDVWTSKDTPSEKALLRYTVSHLSEYLDLSTGDTEYYEEAEFYIVPPIRQYISTGDIIEKDEIRYIVLSPACDITVRRVDAGGNPVINANRILIAKLIAFDRDKLLETGIIKGADGTKAVKSAIEKIIKGQQEKYIFLPEYKQLKASVVDLQNPYAIDFNEYKNYTRIATVATSFLKEIQSRFSSYYARQGQPDLNKDKLVDKHKNALTGSA